MNLDRATNDDLKLREQLRGHYRRLEDDYALEAIIEYREKVLGGWTLCDYENEDTLPAMGELVELAVVNNGKMARTFGGRTECDEAWAWASAEPQLLWAGLPVGLDGLFEWDEDEARTVYWRKLAPLPPVPSAAIKEAGNGKERA